MLGRLESRPMNELEEAAQGHELFRSPGHALQMDQAQEQAEASGWLPPAMIYNWPSVESHSQIINRRQDLYEAMRRLETAVARASGERGWIEEVRHALIGLEESLQRHVNEIESADGLFAEVLDRAPHLSSNVAALREEHRKMVVTCREALVIANRTSVDPNEIRRRVLGVLGRIAIHRQRGSELLFDAYNVDLAAGN